VGAGRKVDPLPLLMSNPPDRTKFQAFGFPEELPTVTSVEGTLLNLGEGAQPWFLADSSLAPGMSGGPASVINGVFAIVEGSHKSTLKFLVPISLAQGFLQEAIPGWQPQKDLPEVGGEENVIGHPPTVAFLMIFDKIVMNEAGSRGNARWDFEVVVDGQHLFLEQGSYKSLSTVKVDKSTGFSAGTGTKIRITCVGTKTGTTRAARGDITIPEWDITETGITRVVPIRFGGPKEGSATLHFTLKRYLRSPTVSPIKEYPIALAWKGAPITVVPLNIAMSLESGPDQAPSDLVYIRFYYPKDGKTAIDVDRLQDEKYQSVDFQMVGKPGKRLVTLGSLGTFQIVIVNVTGNGKGIVGVDLSIVQIQ